VTLEEYRSCLVELKLAYLELLESPRLTQTTAPNIQDRLFAIRNDLIKYAEDMTREIRVLKELFTGRSEFPDSQVPAYQQLLLDANTLAQRVDASLRQANRFIQHAQPLVSEIPTYNHRSRSNR
jgi:hypothetical protein